MGHSALEVSLVTGSLHRIFGWLAGWWAGDREPAHDVGATPAYQFAVKIRRIRTINWATWLVTNR